MDKMQSIDDLNNNESIWIFAYGSLCWKPGFEYEETVTGYVNGFIRRFWQGNESHRGTPSKPGRVATLIPSENGRTWGCAYRIKRNQLSILKYLENRETKLGGYVCVCTAFFPTSSAFGKQRREGNQSEEDDDDEKDVDELGEDDDDEDRDVVKGGQGDEEDDEDDDARGRSSEEDTGKEEEDQQVRNRRRGRSKNEDGEAFPVLCYIALPGNPQWLGEDSEATIATQVRDAQGNCGSNLDYVLSLYKYMRTTFPSEKDEHLEEIVKHL